MPLVDRYAELIMGRASPSSAALPICARRPRATDASGPLCCSGAALGAREKLKCVALALKLEGSAPVASVPTVATSSSKWTSNRSIVRPGARGSVSQAVKVDLLPSQ